MLEKIDLNKTVDKKSYRKVMDEASQKLGLLQRDCKAAGIPVMIVFEGMGAAGKGVQINRLIQSLDPRGFDVYACDRPTEDEQMRPFLWRYWTKTPANGRIAIFDRSWYRSVQVDRFDGLTPEDKLADAYQDILSFEKQLSDDGMVIIKFFLYIDKDEQKKRFKKLDASKETSWRVTKGDWERNKQFDHYLRMNEEMLEKTDTDYAPWAIIESVDKDYAATKIVSAVMDRLQYELEKRQALADDKAVKTAPATTRQRFKNGVLSGIDLSKSLTEEEYKEQVKKLQKRLSELHSELYRLRIPVVIGFERLIRIVSAIGPVIILFTLLVGVVTVIRDFGNITQTGMYGAALAGLRPSPSWLVSSVLYLSLNFLSGSTYFTALGMTAKSRKDAKWGAVWGAATLVLSIAIMNTAILLHGGTAASLSVPTLYLAKKISFVLGAVFSIVLVLGIFSSCSTMMWTVCNRDP